MGWDSMRWDGMGCDGMGVSKTYSCLHAVMILLVLGALMGLAVRSKNYLDLNLPSIVWKQITQSPLTRKDLEYIDKCSINYLDEMSNIDKRNINDNEAFKPAMKV